MNAIYDRSGDANRRCTEMVIRSIEARRLAEQADQRERPSAAFYPSEFYFLTAARFFALAATTPLAVPLP